MRLTRLTDFLTTPMLNNYDETYRTDPVRSTRRSYTHAKDVDGTCGQLD